MFEEPKERPRGEQLPPSKDRAVAGYELVRVGYSIGHDGNPVLADAEAIWRSPLDLAVAVALEVVAWDPDNSRVALVIHDDEPEVVLIDTDGEGTVGRIPLASRRSREAASPDGRWVAHSDCGGPACAGAWGKVSVIELATGRVMELARTLNRDYSPGSPMWAPDGSALAWREGATVFRLEATGYADDVLVGRPAHVVRVATWPGDSAPTVTTLASSDREDIEILGFSPDSRWVLAAEVDATVPRSHGATRQLMAFPLDGGTPKPLTAVSSDAQVVAWLPDAWSGQGAAP